MGVKPKTKGPEYQNKYLNNKKRLHDKITHPSKMLILYTIVLLKVFLMVKINTSRTDIIDIILDAGQCKSLNMIDKIKSNMDTTNSFFILNLVFNRIHS